MQMSYATCTVSLFDNEVSDFEILEEVEVDTSEYEKELLEEFVGNVATA